MGDETVVSDVGQKRVGVKHLVPCHCILPQFRNRKEPLFHRFVVFSVIDVGDNVVPKNVQCDNCGVLHRITEIGRSEIAVGSEESKAVRTIDDIAVGLPSKLLTVLRAYSVPISTWEECEFVLDECDWDRAIVLTKESTGAITRGKILRIKSPDRFSIEQFETTSEFA